MDIKEIIKLDNEVISNELFEELEQVEGLYIQFNGLSGYYTNYYWYTLIIEETNQEVEVYLEN